MEDKIRPEIRDCNPFTTRDTDFPNMSKEEAQYIINKSIRMLEVMNQSPHIPAS